MALDSAQHLWNLISEAGKSEAKVFDQIRTGTVASNYSGAGPAPVLWDGESSPTTNGYPFMQPHCVQPGDKVVGVKRTTGKSELFVLFPYAYSCVDPTEGGGGGGGGAPPVSQSGLILVRALSAAGVITLSVNPAHTLDFQGDNFLCDQPSTGDFRVRLQNLAPTDAPYVTTAPVTGLSNEKVLGDSVIMIGTAAARPATSIAGRLYYAVDTDTLSRDSGSGWDAITLDWDQVTGKPNVVTHTGNLNGNQVVVGNSAADVKILDSPADATKFLNGAATPAFAQVKDSDLSLSAITTNNVNTARHGFAPTLPNDSDMFLDGTGNWTQPPGTGAASGQYRQHVYTMQAGELVFVHSSGDAVFALRSLE
jgi:hypothetical protein